MTDVDIAINNIKICEDFIKKIEAVKSDKTSISYKTRILFYFRSKDTEEAALAIQLCLTGVSVLLDHEVAYVLGQMKQKVSIPFLLELADNKNANEIVRHEAIEALGNFEDFELISKLEKFLHDESVMVKESAYLAIQKLSKPAHENSAFSIYGSRDPAYPFEGSFEEAKKLFASDDLEDKYRAIFYFRDLNTEDACDILAEGFDEQSDLLRHEIAYVFGQMENPYSVPVLIKVLNNKNEKDIVRHEAAEALGNISTPEAIECLKLYENSEIAILRESAQVGLGISNFDDDEYVNLE